MTCITKLCLKTKKHGKTTSPNCPNCGSFMDKVVAWSCPKCGDVCKKKRKWFR